MSGEWRVASGEWRHRALAPFSAGLLRTVAEAIVVALVLCGVALWADPRSLTTGANSVFIVIGELWLVLWPAWRLRRTRARHWWGRIAKGAGRLLLYALIVDLLSYSFFAVGAWPLARGLVHAHPGALFGGFLQSLSLVFWLVFWVRFALKIVAALRRRARQRLRWQLTVSHLTVVVVPLIIVSGLGSVVGSVVASKVILAVLQPDARGFATSIARAVTPDSGAAFDAGSAKTILQGIEAGRIQPRDNPFLNAVAMWSRQPSRVLLLDPNGTVLTAAKLPPPPIEGQSAPVKINGQPLSTPGIQASPATILPAATWRVLRRNTLLGRSAAVSLATTLWPPSTFQQNGFAWSGIRVTGDEVVATPVLVGRRPVAVVVVRVPHVAFPPLTFFSYALFAFGILMLILITMALLPIFGLSSLFGYFMARGLTRRLEAVSRVTTAIAGGDLSQRVHVRAVDESGRLAASVNSMAANLETAMAESQWARTQAEEALRARQELVASISHELRTPLAIVRAHLDNLALRQPVAAGSVVDERVYEDEREVVLTEPTLHALRRETERLAVLVDDLFTLSRAETGTLQVRCEPVDVAALVDEVAALMRPLAQNEGQIALTVDARPGLPYALADAGRLRQILENLVRNAVRHTPDGGIIALSVTAGEDGVVMAVADTGEGMAPEHLTRIFDRFYRVDQARTRELGGAGLGLAIVREFVELMGGRVTVESTLGEGSCFRVFLPLAH